MKYLIVCDYRENLNNYSVAGDKMYNDHPAKKNIVEIMESVRRLGYDCDYFGGIPELIKAVDSDKKYTDCRFLNFTDGLDQNYSRVQAPVLLDILNVPYSGSDVFPSALMNNKHYCKLALNDCPVLMPKSILVNKHMPFKPGNLKQWKYPFFVKPNCEGSSLGISQKNVCHSADEVKNVATELMNQFEEIILEEYIFGLDITNYLIGNKENYYINDIVIAQLKDTSPYAVYDVNAKRDKQRTLYLNEEKLPETVVREIQKASVQIAAAIGARDICRIDYRYNPSTNQFYFIEINSAPRFSSTSEIGFIASKKGQTFDDMVHDYLQAFEDRLALSHGHKSESMGQNLL